MNSLKNIAAGNNIALFGDLQCSSQVGSIIRMKEFTLLCPNEREARIAMQDKETGIEILSQRLINITKSENLIICLLYTSPSPRD